MDIGVAARELGAYDVEGLRTAILALDEQAWSGNTHRQSAYDVHRFTNSIVLVFSDGSGWPELEVRREHGWDLLAEQAVPLMHEIIADHYPPGGTIIRAMAARLPAGAIIKPHRDNHPSFHCGHRVHVPIVSNSRVRFTIDGRPVNLEIGRAYEVNNQAPHSVMNKGDRARIHFIFDYVPPQQLGREQGGA